MALNAPSDIRELGGLPDGIADGKIAPQIGRAARELKRLIGEYETSTGEKAERCKEAEGCLTMAYLVPVLNTFYTAGVTTLQKEIGQLEFLFHSPEQVNAVVERWRSDAEKAVSEYINDADNEGSAGVRWYAI